MLDLSFKSIIMKTFFVCLSLLSLKVLSELNGDHNQVVSSKPINDKQLKEILSSSKSNSFILFYRESDLLSSNTLKNFTEAIVLYEQSLTSSVERKELSFYTINVDSNKRNLKRLGLASFPCGIFLTPVNFYKYKSPFHTQLLLSYLQNSEHKQSPSFTLPRSLSVFEYTLDVLYSGFRGHWAFAFNLLIMFIFFGSILIYAVYSCYNSGSGKTEKVN